MKFTVLSGIFCNTLPNFAAIIFKLITHHNSQEYLGEYGSVLCALDAAFCSWNSENVKYIPYLLFWLELPLDLNKVKTCTSTVCLLIKFRTVPQLVIKTTFSTANLVLSIYFFKLLRAHQLYNSKNRVLQIALLVEIFLNILPNLFSISFKMLTGELLASYIGPTVTALNEMDALICSVLYFYTFYSKNNSS
uniref:Uncharacterized protein n=1 Tax=Ditylenchus dipsaci TaxID=166011 RepID=A0A915E9H4_9BILA